MDSGDILLAIIFIIALHGLVPYIWDLTRPDEDGEPILPYRKIRLLITI